MGEQFTVPEEKLLLDKLIHFFRDSAEKLNVNDGLPDQLLLKNVEQFISKWEASDVEMMDGPYGRAPYGGVIWDDEYTIDELIFKDGVYYYNQNSEEWEEDDEDS